MENLMLEENLKREIEFVSQRVAKGVAFLDGRDAGWRAKINRTTLDCDKPTFCILGQLFGVYLKVPFYRSEYIDHGFLAVDGLTDHVQHRDLRHHYNQRLTETWLQTL